MAAVRKRVRSAVCKVAPLSVEVSCLRTTVDAPTRGVEFHFFNTPRGLQAQCAGEQRFNTNTHFQDSIIWIKQRPVDLWTTHCPPFPAFLNRWPAAGTTSPSARCVHSGPQPGDCPVPALG